MGLAFFIQAAEKAKEAPKEKEVGTSETKIGKSIVIKRKTPKTDPVQATQTDSTLVKD